LIYPIFLCAYSPLPPPSPPYHRFAQRFPAFLFISIYSLLHFFSFISTFKFKLLLPLFSLPPLHAQITRRHPY
jgi:hypothetical protein